MPFVLRYRYLLPGADLDVRGPGTKSRVPALVA